MADYKNVLIDLKKQYGVLEEEEKMAEEKRQQRGQKMNSLRTAIMGIEGLLNPDKEVEPVKDTVVVDFPEGGATQIAGNTTFNYPADKTWEERIKAFLKYTNTPLKISDFLEEFQKYEPEYDEARLKGALNNTIQTMNRKGYLKIYSPPRKEKGFYYANPLWFNDDKLKEEHIPPQKKKLW